IQGTYVAFEAARRAGVPRVIFASSNHAVGFAPRESFPVPDYAFPAPDTYYGVAKVAGEALAGLYHYRYGLDTICIRVLTCSDKPSSARALSTWLSPDDAGRLFEACLSVPDPGSRVVFGVSANTRGGWVSLREAKALGYNPRDDAEAVAGEVLAEFGEADPSGPVVRWLGGEFPLPGLDGKIPRAGGPSGSTPPRWPVRARRCPRPTPSNSKPAASRRLAALAGVVAGHDSEQGDVQ